MYSLSRYAFASVCSLLLVSVLPFAAQAQTTTVPVYAFYFSSYEVGQSVDGGVDFTNGAVFLVPSLTNGQVYTSATLELQMMSGYAGLYGSHDPTETFSMGDGTYVSGRGKTGGLQYGSRVFSSADNNTTVYIQLSGAAVSAINSRSGRDFNLVGFLEDTEPGQYLFTSSSRGTLGDGTAKGVNLLLGTATAPEPDSLGLVMLGGTLLAGFRIQRRKHP